MKMIKYVQDIDAKNADIERVLKSKSSHDTLYNNLKEMKHEYESKIRSLTLDVKTLQSDNKRLQSELAQSKKNEMRSHYESIPRSSFSRAASQSVSLGRNESASKSMFNRTESKSIFGRISFFNRKTKQDASMNNNVAHNVRPVNNTQNPTTSTTSTVPSSTTKNVSVNPNTTQTLSNPISPESNRLSDPFLDDDARSRQLNDALQAFSSHDTVSAELRNAAGTDEFVDEDGNPIN